MYKSVATSKICLVLILHDPGWVIVASCFTDGTKTKKKKKEQMCQGESGISERGTWAHKACFQDDWRGISVEVWMALLDMHGAGWVRSPSCADATFNSDCDKFMRCRMLRFVWGRRAICVLFRSLGLRSACNIFVVRVARLHWDLYFFLFEQCFCGRKAR